MDRETGGAREIWERRLLDPSADPTDLPLWLLNSITKDFSGDREIGSGGFASVYKGILSNGSTVAVKRLSPAVDLDEKSFNREVTSLIKVKHDNVVRFLGFCGETKVKVGNYEGKVVMTDMRQRLLCFEFMPNGGLDKYINVSEGEEETVEVLSIEEGNLQDPQPEAEGQEFEQAPECHNHGPSNFRRGMDPSSSSNEDPVKFWKQQYDLSRVIAKLTEKLLDNAEARANQAVYEARQFELEVQHKMTEYLAQAVVVEQQRNEAIARAVAAEEARDTAIAEKQEVAQNLEFVEQDLLQQLDNAQETIAVLQHEIEVLHLAALPLEPEAGMVILDEPEDEELEEPEVEDQEEIVYSDDEQPIASEDEE